jgi:hypothetical protein
LRSAPSKKSEVIPAEAGIQFLPGAQFAAWNWIPACAGNDTAGGATPPAMDIATLAC